MKKEKDPELDGEYFKSKIQQNKTNKQKKPQQLQKGF